jgi:hypothetical protein
MNESVNRKTFQVPISIFGLNELLGGKTAAVEELGERQQKAVSVGQTAEKAELERP